MTEKLQIRDNVLTGSPLVSLPVCAHEMLGHYLVCQYAASKDDIDHRICGPFGGQSTGLRCSCGRTTFEWRPEQ